MKKEFILSYDRRSLFSVLQNHASLTPSVGPTHTFFKYTGEHQDNGLAAIGDVFHGLAMHAIFARRHELETLATQIHPIPYIVAQRDNDQVWQYQRGKGVGEERLAGDDSIAPGGHVEIVDAVNSAPAVAYMMKFCMGLPAWNDYSDDVKAMITATIRELHEEILVRPTQNVRGGFNLDELFKFELLGLLFDETDEVGKVHLGLVFRLRLPSDWEVLSREAQIENRGFKLPEKLLAEHRDGLIKLESWSRILAHRLYDERSLLADKA